MASLTPRQLADLPQSYRMLELGCGQVKRWERSIAVDFSPRSRTADIIHDLNSVPWPFDNSSFDGIIAEHVLEHLGPIVPIVEEAHRILKPGGILYVEVPHFSSHCYYTDPTHTHPFSARSFDYFVPPLPGSDPSLFDFEYSGTARFALRSVRLNPASRGAFRRWIGRRANARMFKYERDWAWIFPMETINFELAAIK